MPRKIEIPNLDDLLRRYIAGETEQKLAAECGVSRSAFRLRLIEANITPRNVSDTMYIRWQTADERLRSAMLNNAHASTRGKTVTEDKLINRAIGCERKSPNVAHAESVLADWLRERGLNVIPQKAIGKYNVDLAVQVPPIAVELFGGGWHAYGSHRERFAPRVEHILNAGWAMVIIWLDARRYPLSVACADYIVTLTQEISRQESPRCQYRVILGDGQPAPAIESKLNTPAFVERLCNGSNRAE